MIFFSIDAVRTGTVTTEMIYGRPMIVYYISHSKNKRFRIFGRGDTCFTICFDEVTLHNFYSYDKYTDKWKFYDGIKCYKSDFGVYVNINGNRCYCTHICPAWMADGHAHFE